MLVTFLVDIDDTLIMYIDSYLNVNFRMNGNIEKYKKGVPNKKLIKKLNKLYRNNTIIIYTGRGWDKLAFTKKQLKKFGIKYDSLIMGKPPGIIIDADSLQELP